jgi:hypothetical protein
MDIPLVANFPITVEDIARFYGGPSKMLPDECDCDGLSCEDLACPRFWVAFFTELTEDDILDCVEATLQG